MTAEMWISSYIQNNKVVTIAYLKYISLVISVNLSLQMCEFDFFFHFKISKRKKNRISLAWFFVLQRGDIDQWLLSHANLDTVNRRSNEAAIRMKSF